MSLRPGFARADTDNFNNIQRESSSESSQPTSSKHAAPEVLKSADAKDGGHIDVQEGIQEFNIDDADNDAAEYRKGATIETAADLVAQIIHLEDNPDEATLTFRSWFLGRLSDNNLIVCSSILITLLRHWAFYLCVCSAGDFLLQASDHLCVPRLLDRHRVCSRRCYGCFHPS